MLATEVLDNLPHDKLRVPRDAGPLAEAHAIEQPSGANGERAAWKEEMHPLQDDSLEQVSKLLGLNSYEGVVALHDALVERPTMGCKRTRAFLGDPSERSLPRAQGGAKHPCECSDTEDAPTDAWSLERVHGCLRSYVLLEVAPLLPMRLLPALRLLTIATHIASASQGMSPLHYHTTPLSVMLDSIARSQLVCLRRLLRALKHAAPEHQLTIADFSWLPPQPGGVVNAPLVQSQRNGISKDHG